MQTRVPETIADFDPFAPEMCSNPYPHYARLRERTPVSRSPLGFWFLSKHDHLAQYFTDRTLRREYEAGQKVRMGPEIVDEEYYRLFRKMLFVLDDPEHKRVRRLFTGAFTARRVTDIRPHTEAIANRLIDAVADAREMDVVADYTSQLPKRVIGQLLGVPEEDHLMVGGLADGLDAVFEFLPMDAGGLAEANRTCKALYDYFSDLVAQRRRTPQDDLLTAMVEVGNEDDGRLSHEELISNAVLLYAAGQGTTTGALGLAVLSLHRNPDQLELLRREPDLLRNAVEELLRYDHSAHATIRITTQPTRYGDVEIPAGEGVVAFLGAALRDPEAFADPDTLDLRRDLRKRPISFGGGPAMCLGHHLARAEMEIAIATLEQRCPAMTLDTVDPPYKGSPVIRGPKTLIGRW